MAYNMSEEEREAAFPVHIEMDENGPVIDLGERAKMVNIPQEGCALVDFVRDEDGNLRIKTVCFEGDPDSEDSLEQALGKVAKEMDDEKSAPAEDAEEETE